MSEEADQPPIRIVVAIADAALADRIAALLGSMAAVQLVGAGEPADVAVVMPAEPALDADDMALSPREIEVLALLAEGASNKVIARRLGISVHTAKFHVGRVIDKLDAIGRTDAVAHALRLGVITL